MDINTAAKKVFDACKEAHEDLQVTFDANEITLYWENLRIDVQPTNLTNALKVVKDAKALGARFE